MKEYNSVQLEDAEVLALMDIAQLTNFPFTPIPFLHDFDNALKTSDYGNFFWYKDHQVVGLVFLSSDLKKLPKSIGNFSYLKYLIMYNISLQNIPSTFKNLQNLELFRFSYDPEEFSGVVLDFPDIFQDLKSLKTFEISGILSIYIPPSFIELENLEELKLEYCRFFANHVNFEQVVIKETKPFETNELPKDIGKLKSLKRLVLKDLRKFEFPFSIINLVSLKELNLSFSKDIKNKDIIFSIKSLEQLNLEGCQLRNIPKTINNLVNLKTLSLSNNYLKEIPFEITKCERLEKINIRTNWFEKELLALNSLKNLRTIIYDKLNHEIIPKELFKNKNIEFKGI